jgi:hypothetical protein
MLEREPLPVKDRQGLISAYGVNVQKADIEVGVVYHPPRKLSETYTVPGVYDLQLTFGTNGALIFTLHLNERQGLLLGDLILQTLANAKENGSAKDVLVFRPEDNEVEE